MAADDIPKPVSTVVGDVLGSYYYSHRRIESLFAEAGAPGDPPEGSCVDKSREWLRRASKDSRVDGLKVLGAALHEFMEVDPSPISAESWATGKAKIEKVMADNGLTYLHGGRVARAGTSLQTKTLKQLLQARDLASLEVEFHRALDASSADPAQAVTAACAMLESLFKVYIEDEGLEMPSTPTVKPLWSVVQKHLKLDPGRFEDDDIKKILSGLSSVVDGIGALRSHVGSAHGRGRTPYAVQERHARLAVNGAVTVTTFIVQTWSARKNGKAP
jgi:hypothetical protein